MYYDVKEETGRALHMYMPSHLNPKLKVCLDLPSEQQYRRSLLCTQHWQDTQDQGQPLFTLAWPMGSTKSLSNIFSLTGKDSPYRISFSRNTTGSGSLMEAFRSPRASSLSYGAMTCSQQRAPFCTCAAMAAAHRDNLPQMRRLELLWQLPLHSCTLVQRLWSMQGMLLQQGPLLLHLPWAFLLQLGDHSESLLIQKEPTHLQARHMAVPGGIALRVLCRHACCSAIGASEYDGHWDGAGRHVQSFGSGVDDLVNGLHGKVEGHKLHHWAQACHGCSTANAGESSLQHHHSSLDGWGRPSAQHSQIDGRGAFLGGRQAEQEPHLCDGSVPHTHGAVLLQEASCNLQEGISLFGQQSVDTKAPWRWRIACLSHLVGALILANLHVLASHQHCSLCCTK